MLTVEAGLTPCFSNIVA